MVELDAAESLGESEDAPTAVGVVVSLTGDSEDRCSRLLAAILLAEFIRIFLT